MISISARSRPASSILGVVAIAGGLALWYFSNRLPPIPNRVLRIGFEVNPPFQLRTDNGFGGLAIETISEAAKRAGIRLQWVETGTSSDEAFQKRLVDLWPLMTDLPDRRKRLYLSEPWLHSSHVLLLKASSASPEKEFTGRIALFKLPLHFRLLRAEFPKAELVQFGDSREVLKEVCKGTAAASFLEGRVALAALKEKPPECASTAFRAQTLPDLTFNNCVASSFEAAGAAARIRGEIGNLFRDGTLAVMMAKYSFYGLDDTWATYHMMEAAERARWMSWGISGLTLAAVVIGWRAFSSRQRKRAEAVLRESEERFRNMADTAPVMIWVASPDKMFTFFNKTWLDFTGRTMEQELGTGWAASLHPEDLESCYESFCSAFDARRSFRIECRLRRADGQYRWTLCTGVPRFAPGEIFAGYIGCDIDITDLQSEERFRQLAENIDQVFWMVDLDKKKTLYISPAFEKVWGCGSASLYRDREWLTETVHSEDRVHFIEFFEKLKAEPLEEFYRIVRSDGSVRWIYDRGFPVRDPQGKPYRLVGIAEDITAHREMEEQLRQAHKMEAVGRLAGGIAHDFNNLLTIIGGYSRMLLDESQTEGPRRERLEQILNAANRAGTLTKQLLAFSRQHVLQPKLINVNHLLTNMEVLLRRIIGEHITVETVFQPDIDCISVDPHQLEQVVLNLAANARDAMPNGGEFRIETRVDNAAEIQTEGNPNGPRRYVRLTISDTGCGMDSRTRERAFEPFFTTKGVGKGTGLGLSTAYGIVHQNQGTIHVSSEPGHGTVFELSFPSLPNPEADIESSVDRAATPEGTGTILVAEDEPALRRLVRETLEQLGYTVLDAADGYEALRVLEQHNSAIDLLLTDVIMPLMNGHELAMRLETIRPGTKVLYMSGYTDDMLAFHGIAQPEIDFIQKPFTPSELGAKLKVLLSTGKRTEQ